MDSPLLNTLIINRHGRVYRFTAIENGLECHVCYWYGQVSAPTDEKPSYHAFVEQKYTPYERMQADRPFSSRQQAINWVADQLKRVDDEASADASNAESNASES